LALHLKLQCLPAGSGWPNNGSGNSNEEDRFYGSRRYRVLSPREY